MTDSTFRNINRLFIKISKLSNNSIESKFVTRKWIGVHDL